MDRTERRLERQKKKKRKRKINNIGIQEKGEVL